MDKDQKIEQIKQKIEYLIPYYGYCPTIDEMKEVGFGGLKNQIQRLELNIEYFQKLIGAEPKIRPKEYWYDINNLEHEIKKIAEDRQFPSLNKIRKNFGDNVIFAISSFGGADIVAKKIGLNPSFLLEGQNNHFLTNKNKVIISAFLFVNNIKHESNGLIIRNFFYDFKIDNFYIEIEEEWRDVEKRKELHSKLKHSVIYVKGDVFNLSLKEICDNFINIFLSNGIQVNKILEKVDCICWDEIIITTKLKSIIEETNDFPTREFLYKTNKNSLVSAIQQFGGFYYFREKFGYLDRENWTREDAIEELEEFNQFPNNYQLKQLKRNSLIKAIMVFGGFNNFHKELSPNSKIQKLKWDDEKSINEIKKICLELRLFPSSCDLRKINKTLESHLNYAKISMDVLYNKIVFKFSDLVDGDLFSIKTSNQQIKHCRRVENFYFYPEDEDPAVAICINDGFFVLSSEISINDEIRFEKDNLECIFEGKS